MKFFQIILALFISLLAGGVVFIVLGYGAFFLGFGVLAIGAFELVHPLMAIPFIGGFYVFIRVFMSMMKNESEPEEFAQRRTNMPPPEPPATGLYNFQMLSSSYHMLQWLADLPYQHICQNIEQLMRQQMPDSRLLDIAATSMPQWQTVEVLEEENGQTVAISRTGMAFEFVLHVSGNGQTHQLTGVYTWAGSRLNRPPAEQRQRIWLDLNGTLADFGGSRMAKRLKAAN